MNNATKCMEITRIGAQALICDSRDMLIWDSKDTFMYHPMNTSANAPK